MLGRDINLYQIRPIELGVLKSFEFVSQLRRTSAIVRQFGAQGVDVFVKGAPECMKDICLADSCKGTFLPIQTPTSAKLIIRF